MKKFIKKYINTIILLLVLITVFQILPAIQVIQLPTAGAFHNLLSNLGYSSSGHTGFSASLDYEIVTLAVSTTTVSLASITILDITKTHLDINGLDQKVNVDYFYLSTNTVVLSDAIATGSKIKISRWD